jgi:hypothetical protein
MSLRDSVIFGMDAEILKEWMKDEQIKTSLQKLLDIGGAVKWFFKLVFSFDIIIEIIMLN